MKISSTTIKRLREGHGWYQTDLALHAGLSRPFITQIENGEREPSAVALAAIAKALGVDPSDLVDVEAVCPHCGTTFNLP